MPLCKMKKENQGGADSDGHRFDGPVEEMEDGLYLGEELGICDEEAMIQDEMNILRSCLEEDNDPCIMIHASVRTESALMNGAKSADKVQGQKDLSFSTRGVAVDPRKMCMSRSPEIRTALRDWILKIQKNQSQC